MEQYFSNLFEDIRYERGLQLLLSLKDPDMLKQSKLTYHEINIRKNLALEKLHRHRCLKEYFALSILEQCFLLAK